MLATLVLIITVPVVCGGLALAVSRPSRRDGAGRIALIAPAVVVVLGWPLWQQVVSGETILVPVPWFPSVNLTADLRVDRLGAFFVLLIGLIGLGVVQYSRYYLAEKATGAYWGLLLAFMGAMLGIVLSDSLLLMFVFWELTTITSALLIGMDFERGDAKYGAIQAFLVTGVGGLALLAGIVLLGQISGTYALSELAQPERVAALLADPRHRVALGLILVGAFTKSAQVPFHFWLPGAMAAPAPISSYLHSATMVKAGVFLLGRMFPIFSGSEMWFPVLSSVGLATFFFAGWLALRTYDLKQLLAYSTVAYLGVLTALYGYAAKMGLRGELLHIANHAMYKSALFLLMGWLEKRAGTRDLSLLARERWFPQAWFGGLLFGIGALAMAGVPFLLGFASKELFYEAIIGEEFEGITPAMIVAVAASALAVAYALKVFVSTFFGPDEPPDGRGYPAHKISPWLLIVPALLLVPQVVGGVIPGWFLGSVLVEPDVYWTGFAVWHHIDAALAMSVSMFTLGLLLYVSWRRIAALRAVPGAQWVSHYLAQSVVDLATWLSRTAQAGGHPRYLAVILLFTIGCATAGIAWGGVAVAEVLGPLGPDLNLGLVPGLAVIGGALLTLIARKRISKVVMMSLTGYGLAVFYVLFRAPDLALTQILAETVLLILLLLIFRRLPPLHDDGRSPFQKLAHGAVAVVVGLALAVLAWSAGSHAAVDRAGAEQVRRALPEAHGRNVVNVILVDFRGTDTLGEIVVLAIAALGAVALFRAGMEEPAVEAPEPTETPEPATVGRSNHI